MGVQPREKLRSSVVMPFLGYDDGFEGLAPVGWFPRGASFYGALERIT